MKYMSFIDEMRTPTAPTNQRTRLQYDTSDSTCTGTLFDILGEQATWVDLSHACMHACNSLAG